MDYGVHMRKRTHMQVHRVCGLKDDPHTMIGIKDVEARNVSL